jgi:hypothetical protein
MYLVRVTHRPPSPNCSWPLPTTATAHYLDTMPLSRHPLMNGQADSLEAVALAALEGSAAPVGVVRTAARGARLEVRGSVVHATLARVPLGASKVVILAIGLRIHAASEQYQRTGIAS